VAQTLRDTSVREIERRLGELRDGQGASLLTSVLTHVAWVPSEWERAADRVLAGMGERVPSRTILLHPDPGAQADRIDAQVALECFPAPRRSVSAELIRIWLRGTIARAPASVVVPLQIPDLPAFLRWRGRPAFGSGVFEQLTGVSDRLIVDSAEWGERLRPAYRRLAESFDRVVVSDLAWTRSLGHRAGLAALWPGIREARVLEIKGPRADAVLLHAWLRSRLKTAIRLRHEDSGSLSRVVVDGEPVHVPRRLARSASDQLSDQLEVYTRDRIYEAAVRAV
jgi:Glucose-6-phosphate dehydrogenase subunit N-terminal domain